MTMKRTLTVLALAVGGLLGSATPARADITFFLGFSPKPEMRPTRGFAAGVSMLIVGFEFDYASTSADEAAGAPSLRTGMINGLVMTPTKTQLYLTAGAGFYREALVGSSETSVGTNIGGGIKFGLVGPIQIRVDYRIFNLRGDARFKNPQRIYAGVNWHF
jgi:opacity protein-like surface antigen